VRSRTPSGCVLLVSVVICVLFHSRREQSFSVPQDGQASLRSMNVLKSCHGSVKTYVGASARFGARHSAIARAARGNDLVVSPGLVVAVDFTMTRDDTGEVLESTEGKSPLEFACGAGKVFPTLDAGVDGMRVGQTKNFTLTQDFPRDDDLVKAYFAGFVPSQSVPGDIIAVWGKNATLVSKNESIAMLDFNHPFAGLSLTMTTTIVSVKHQKAYDPKKGCPYNAFLRLVRIRKKPEEVEFAVDTVSPGDGSHYAKPGDQLVIHYTGTLAASGVKFDSSIDRGSPNLVKIGVGQVIRGLDMGIMKMSLGEKALVKIPSALGYGEKGAGEIVPPNADLLFEVELLKIN